jgi:hypothetical protein
MIYHSSLVQTSHDTERLTITIHNSRRSVYAYRIKMSYKCIRITNYNTLFVIWARNCKLVHYYSIGEMHNGIKGISFHNSTSIILFIQILMTNNVPSYFFNHQIYFIDLRVLQILLLAFLHDRGLYYVWWSTTFQYKL